MKLTTLKYFVVVATELSFTKAAQKLYISQPTLSRRIKELETELGVSLFERHSHTIVLTKAGEIFFKEVLDVLERIERLPDLFTKGEKLMTTEPPELLRIGYLADFNLANLFSKISEFKQEYPQAHFSLKTASPIELVKELASGNLDFIIDLGMYLDKENPTKLFAKNNLKLAVAAGHPLSNRISVGFDELAKEKFILLERQQSPLVVDYVITQALSNGFNLNVSEYAKSIERGLTLVSLNKGISFIYSAMDDGNLEDKYNIKFIPLKAPDNEQDLLVARNKNSDSALKQLFFESLP